MRITILGCGGSNGVPMIGGPDGKGDWGECDPANPRNRRTRSSIVVENEGHCLLVDTSPDLREQLIGAGIGSISAVFYTHEHADHTHGLNELRQLARINGRQMDVYADAQTLASLRQRFDYAFEAPPKGSPYPTILKAHIIDGPMKFGALKITPFAQDHGFGTETLGLRFDAGVRAAAYSTDVTALPEAAFEVLDGLGLWVVDCTRYEPHPTHAHFEKTLEWIARVKPDRAILTHMDQTLDHDELASRCPPGVEPAHDGMVIEL